MYNRVSYKTYFIVGFMTKILLLSVYTHPDGWRKMSISITLCANTTFLLVLTLHVKVKLLEVVVHTIEKD